MPGCALRPLRSEAGKGEVEHGRPLLFTEAFALMGLAQPRPGRHGLEHGELLRAEVLGPDHLAVVKGDEIAVPIVGLPGGTNPPVVLQRLPLQDGRRGLGPRLGERHPSGLVNSLGGELS